MDEHRFQRTKVARYFAPKVVDARYRGLIAARADAFLARLDTGETVDMSEPTLHFSAQVAAQVIGLTDSSQEAMARRLVGFFDHPAAVLEPGASGWRPLLSLPAALPGSVDLLRFHLKDVRPALKARRAPGGRALPPHRRGVVGARDRHGARHLRRRRHGHHPRVPAGLRLAPA